jgi:hypothetical protein
MDAASISALAGLVTSAAGTISSASSQQQAGEVKNRAAAIQAAGVTYRAETNAAIGEYRAGLTEWVAATNENLAMARADRIESTAEAQAAQAKAQAAAQADIITRSTSRVMGRATAAFGASGVSGGSTLYVLNDIATEGELQADLARYGGKLQAEWGIYGAQVQAADIRQQAKFDTQSAGAQATIYRTLATAERTSGQIGAAALYAGGAAAQDAATMGAGTTLLTGLGKVATGAGDLFDKGSKTTTTTPTGADAASASKATQFLPSGVGQTSGVGSSY